MHPLWHSCSLGFGVPQFLQLCWQAPHLSRVWLSLQQFRHLYGSGTDIFTLKHSDAILTLSGRLVEKVRRIVSEIPVLHVRVDA